MTAPRPDPYRILGLSPSASDAEVRSAYRRLVRQHHPDHNQGSEESEQRFEEIQAAYEEIVRRRKAGVTGSAWRAGPTTGATHGPAAEAHDPALDARIADLERQLREANAARERARRAAREAAAADAREAAAGAREAGAGQRRRPTDEELGYVTTDDSLSKIFADVREQFSERLAELRDSPLGKRVEELIDELDERRGS